MSGGRRGVPHVLLLAMLLAGTVYMAGAVHKQLLNEVYQVGEGVGLCVGGSRDAVLWWRCSALGAGLAAGSLRF